MAVYHYKAHDSKGGIVRGAVDAAERHLAMQKLQAEGLSPITMKAVEIESRSILSKIRECAKSLRVTRTRPPGEDANKNPYGAQREGVARIVLKRLMELHDSGLPVGDSIRILSQRLHDKEQKQVVQNLWN